MESEERQIGSRARLFTMVVLVMLTVLQLFVIHMVIALHRDVRAQRDDLATKDDLINLALNLGPSDPAMARLKGPCTHCHAADRFARPQAELEDIRTLVQRMHERAAGQISPQEVPGIEAALTFLKCARCHSGERLKEMAILSPRQRWDLIIQMTKQPGATMTPEDARRIRDSYGDFWDWRAP